MARSSVSPKGQRNESKNESTNSWGNTWRLPRRPIDKCLCEIVWVPFCLSCCWLFPFPLAFPLLTLMKRQRAFSSLSSSTWPIKGTFQMAFRCESAAACLPSVQLSCFQIEGESCCHGNLNVLLHVYLHFYCLSGMPWRIGDVPANRRAKARNKT